MGEYQFKQYRRKQVAELRPITHGECRGFHTYGGPLRSQNVEVSISKEDLSAGSPKEGDMIARNPKNHKDQWLVAKQYFEDNFEPIEGEGFKFEHTPKGLDFGAALQALKNGRRVAREGWNGKNMFLFLLPANDGIPTTAIHDPALRKVIETELGTNTFDAYGSIRMFTADKKILTGWLASQTDMLANDWAILPNPTV